MSDTLAEIEGMGDLASDGRPESRTHLEEISRAMVKLYKEQFGRGPTKARANWAGEDTLVCILEEMLTPGEKTLVAIGEHERLKDVRLTVQQARRMDFVRLVEDITGRTVRSLVGGLDPYEDLAVHVFVLEPLGP